MKIRDLSPAGKSTLNTGTVLRRDNGGGASFFREHLEAVNEKNYAERLRAMSDAIAEQGDRIGRRADIVELKRYREMVAEFLNEAVRYSFEFHKESRMDARGRHRIYAVVKRINERLEDLTTEVLKEQQDNIKIMEAIGDIKGLILDMTM